MKHLVLIGWILAVAPCRAQQKDSIATMKLFLRVCNTYKTLPVRVDVDIANSANYIVEARDTSHTRARFCLRKEGSYIAFDEMEQIANDSLMLLVDTMTRKMLLYQHHNSLTQEMKAALGWQTRDSSVKRMAAQYLVGADLLTTDTAEIRMTDRRTVGTSGLPVEVIVVLYNPANLQPYLIRQVRRGLIPLSVHDYQQLSLAPDARKELFFHSGDSWAIIREKVSVFRYDRISHMETELLPASIYDRVTRDTGGNFKPVPKYEGYLVVKQF